MRFADYVKEGPGGKLSSMRLLMGVWGLGLFAVWALISWRAGDLLAIPESVVTVFGLVIGGKAVQKFGE